MICQTEAHVGRQADSLDEGGGVAIFEKRIVVIVVFVT